MLSHTAVLAVSRVVSEKNAFGGSYIFNVYTAHDSSVVSHCLHMGFPYMTGTLHCMSSFQARPTQMHIQFNATSHLHVLFLIRTS